MAAKGLRYERADGQLVLVYGRRRIGKSFLLENFATGKSVVFYQAAQRAEETELSGFIASAIPAALLDIALDKALRAHDEAPSSEQIVNQYKIGQPIEILQNVHEP